MKKYKKKVDDNNIAKDKLKNITTKKEIIIKDNGTRRYSEDS